MDVKMIVQCLACDDFHAVFMNGLLGSMLADPDDVRAVCDVCRRRTPHRAVGFR